MKRLGLVTLLLLALWPATSDAVVGPGCLPAPLPTGPAPGAASDSVNVLDFDDAATMTLWRHQCADSPDWVALLRVAPTVGNPFICGPGFDLVQGTHVHIVFLRLSLFSAPFCGNIVLPTTFVVDHFPSATPLNAAQAFSLSFGGFVNFATVQYDMNLPAAGPPPPTPPSIAVVPTGCTTCSPGQTIGFVINVTNPGPGALPVELKGGLRIGGVPIGLVDLRLDLPPGVTPVGLIPNMALPGGIPPTAITVEAAILEPALGVTLARDDVVVNVGP